ncbi:MAG: winged helix-turn-helix transcriptional regulator, partial [Thermoplasmata archaeon]
MWYGGCCGSYSRTGYASSDNGVIWTKYRANPVLDIGFRGTWDDMQSAAPAVLQHGSTYHMWYSGHDGKNYRIGYATSPDRSSWVKLASSPEVLDAYKISDIVGGLTYTVELAVPSTADLDLFIFSASGGRDDALASSKNEGSGADETIRFTGPTTGNYILVITNENGGTGTYTLLAKSPPSVNAGKDRNADGDGSISFKAEAYYPGLTQNPDKYRAWAVDISADGQYLAFSWNKNVTFFSTASSVPLWTLDTQDVVHDLKLSDDGQHLAVLSNKTLYFFDTGTSVPLWSVNIGYYGGIGPGNQLDMTRDGKFIACSAWGNRVLVFDSTSFAPASPYWDYDFGDEVKVVKFSGDGRYLAVGGLHSHEFQIAWIPGRNVKWTYVSSDVFYSASLSEDGSMISQGQGNQHNVSVFNSDSNTPEWSYELEGAQFEQVMSDDGKYLASSNHWDSLPDSWNGIAFWNTSSSIPIWTYEIEPGYYSKINTVDMDRNANYVVGGCLNNNVYLFSQLGDNLPGWGPDDNEPVFTFSTDGWIRFNGVSISADGTHFAAASWDGSVYLFSTAGIPHLVWSWNSSSPVPASVEYKWDFDAKVDSDGDGNFKNDADAQGPNPTYTYDENGVYTVTLSVTDEHGTSNVHTIVVTVDSLPTTGEGGELFKPGLALTTAAIIAALLICLLAGSTEVGKMRWIPIFSPLYSRLKNGEVLDQFTRGRIYEHIRKNPGDHYNNIKQELGLNNGSLAYHLHTLERENYIKSKRDGIFKHFYPTGMKIPERPIMRLSELERDIMNAIRRNPGATQKDISKVLKISQQVVSYHVKLMSDAGLIRHEQRDRKYRYFCN